MIKVLKRFFDFSGKENKKRFIASIILEIFSSIFSEARFVAAFFLIEGIVYDMGLTSGTLFLNEGMTTRRFIIIVSILLVSLIGMISLKSVSTMKQTRGGYITAANKRMEIALKLKYLPMGFYNKNSLGYITGVTTNSMEALGNIATRVVMMMLNGFITTAIFVVFIFGFSWQFGLVSLATVLVFIGVMALQQVAAKKITSRKMKADTELVNSVLEYTDGIIEVKSNNMMDSANNKLSSQINESRNVSRELEFRFTRFTIFHSITLYTGSVGLILLSIVLTLNGTLSVAMGIVMTFMSVIVFNEISASGTYSSLLRAVSALMDKAEGILNEKDMKDDGKAITPSDYTIEIADVSFSYSNKKVIDNVSFTIPENTMTAIVGPSGSGKSTICKLIARFYDVEDGSIKIGGVDIRDYSINSLMRNFSFVFQNVYLFNDTIMNNIRFGNDNATEEEVINAAKKACVHDFISSLPEGYNTRLSDGGLNLSGGERQRISIARAMLKDSPIIILDEATANIDPENEALLAEAFHHLTENKTVIMIAHKLNTVKKADQIIVFDEGKIAETGKHQELLDKNGIYKRFVDSRCEAVGWKI